MSINGRQAAFYNHILVFALVYLFAQPFAVQAGQDEEQSTRVEKIEGADLRVAELKRWRNEISKTLKILRSQYGYLDRGMRRTLDAYLKKARVDWARKNYFDNWSDNLAWVWQLNDNSVMKYLSRHGGYLDDVLNQTKGGGRLTDRHVVYYRAGMVKWRDKAKAFDAAYLECIFPRFARAGRLWDEYNNLNSAYLSKRGDEAKALKKKGDLRYKQGQQQLALAYACEKDVIVPLTAKDVFKAIELSPKRPSLVLP